MTSIPFVSEQRIREAVTSIYAIATDPTALPAALDGLADLLGGKGLLMGPLSRAAVADPSLVTYASSVFHDAIPDYLDHYLALNPRKNWLTSNNFSDIIFSDHDIMDDRELKRHAFYNDFLIKNENLYCLDQLKTIESKQKIWISVQYSHRAPPPEVWSREIFSMLTSHLHQALDIYGRMRALQPGEAALLEQFDCPAVILSARGRVLRTNAAMEGWVDSRISLRGGRLSAVNASDCARLDRLLADVTRRASGGSAPDLVSLVGDGTRPPLLVRASPFRVSEIRLGIDAFMEDMPAILVLFHETRRAVGTEQATREALRSLGLTPAEVKVAASIASGRSPEEAAEDLGIALSTARHHVKRIYEKLAIRRQSELVRIVNDVAHFAAGAGDRG
jgi:DNA-binding CsgD family transcriptional regulator